MLAGVEQDGIRINAPYGMRLDAGYVKNASDDTASSTSLIKNERETVSRRLKHAPEQLAISADEEKLKEPVPNWGENNFYTWDEVLKWSIGKWNSILEKA